MVPIRLEFQIAGQDAAIAGVNALATGIGDAMAGAAARMTSSFQGAVLTVQQILRGIGQLSPGGGPLGGQAAGSGAAQAAVLQAAQATTALNGMSAAGVAAGGKVAAAMTAGFTPLQTIRGLVDEVGGAFRSATNFAIRLNGSIYAIEAAGRGLRGLFVSPFEDIAKMGEEARKFEMAISANVGGMSSARAVDVALERSLPNSPLTLAETRQTGLAATRLASTSPQLGLLDQTGAAQFIQQIGDMMARLQVLNPERTPELVERSVQQYLEGSPRALRTVGIDPKDIEALAKTTSHELQGNQAEMLRALQQLVKSRVPDSTLDQRGNLPSVSLQKLKDEFQILAERIALDSPLFDTVGQKFHGMMMTLAESLDDPEMQAHLRSIGESMSVIFNNAMNAGGELLRTLSGADSIAKTPEAIAGQVDTLAHKIADWSKELPGIANDVGTGLHNIAVMLKTFAGELSEISQMRGQPGGVAAGVGGSFVASWLLDKQRRLDPGGREDERLQDLVSTLNKMGVGGVAVRQASQGQSTLTNLVGPSGGDAGWLGDTYSGSVLDTRGVKDSRVRQLVEKLYGRLESDDNLNVQDVLAQMPDLQAKLIAATKGTSTTIKPSGNLSPLGDADRATFDRISIGKEVTSTGQLYSSRFGAEDRAIESLSGLLPATAEKWQESLKLTNTYLANILGNYTLGPNDKSPGSFFDKVREFGTQRIGQDQAFIQHIRGDVEPGLTDAARDQVEKQWVARLLAEINMLGDGMDQEVAKAMQALQTASGRAALKVMLDARSLTPEARAALVNRTAGGEMDFERQTTAARLKVQPGQLTPEQIASGGLASIPPDLQPQAVSQILSSNLAAITERGKFDRSPQVTSLLGGPGVGNEQLAFLQQMLPILEGQKDAASSKLNASTGAGRDQAQVNFDLTSEAVRNVKSQIDQLSVSTNLALQGFVQFGNGAQSAMANTLGKGIENLILRTGTLKDLMRSFAQQIVSDFSKMASNTFMNSIFGDPSKGGGMGNLLGNLINGTAGSAQGGLIGAAANWFSGPAVTPNPVNPPMYYAGEGGGAAAANGAVWAGGFTPFAGGGVVSKPTLGLVGERPDGMHEAVIPMPGGKVPFGMGPGGAYAMLPGGRKIPAAMAFAEGGVAAGGLGLSDRDYSGGSYGGGGATGGGQMELHVYNVSSIEEAHQRGYKAAANQVLNQVFKEAGPGGKIRRMLGKQT